MSTKNLQRIFNAIGIVLIIVLSIGLFKFNRKLEEDQLAEDEVIEVENENIDIEEEKKEYDIPPIEVPKKDSNIEDSNVPEYKEEVKEVDGNKVIVKPTLPPKKEKTPEAMEKPKTEPKPKEPPKLEEDNEDKKKDKSKTDEKPPTYEKKEEPKEVKGGTGSDGVLRDLNGNPIHVEGDPNAKPNIVNGSDLGEPGDPEMGQGDKF